MHTVLDKWSPNTDLGNLILCDKKENTFYILKIKVGSEPEHSPIPLILVRKNSDFLYCLSALKTAFQYVLLELQLLSAILPKGYSHISMEYSPHVKNKRLDYTAAWEKWSREHPGKQPFVEALCLVDNDGRIIGWNVAPNSVLNDFFSSHPSLGFLENARLAIHTYNHWLKMVSEHGFITILGYFISPFFEIEVLLKKNDALVLTI